MLSLEQDIGVKIRGMRRLKRLRLKDVADAIECSESLLSKIENNKVQPSLKVLHKIAAVLDTTIGALFADNLKDDITIHRAGDRPVVKTSAENSEGSIVLERISPFGDDQMLEANIHVIDAGNFSGGDISHLGEEVGYVLEGEFELTIEDKTHLLKKGDSFYFRSELRHSYRNTSLSLCRVLWVNTPPTF